MGKLIVGLIGVGAVIFAVAIGVGNTVAAVIGFLLFAAGIVVGKLMR